MPASAYLKRLRVDEARAKIKYDLRCIPLLAHPRSRPGDSNAAAYDWPT